MKVILFVLLSGVFCITFGDLYVGGMGLPSSAPSINQAGSTDDWEINILNEFTCPFADIILGLDYIGNFNKLAFTSDFQDSVYLIDLDTGAFFGGVPLESEHVFGVCYPGEFHCNDYFDTVMYYYSGPAWDTYPNPYENDGRGLDFNNGYIWQAYGPITGATNAECVSFLPYTGGSSTIYPLSDIPYGTQLSGLTTWPGASSMNLAVTAYIVHYIWLYELNGSSMDYLGSVELPGSFLMSWGIAYVEPRDTFYWSWRDYSNVDHITEFELISTGLEPATWGSIKASF